jgi:hypothetical protein
MYLDAIAARIADELGPEALPEHERTQQLLRSYAVLARAKGTAVTPEDIHDAWVAWMAEIEPDHEALKPYAALDDQTRREDEPFVAAVRAVAARLRSK